MSRWIWGPAVLAAILRRRARRCTRSRAAGTLVASTPSPRAVFSATPWSSPPARRLCLTQRDDPARRAPGCACRCGPSGGPARRSPSHCAAAVTRRRSRCPRATRTRACSTSRCAPPATATLGEVCVARDGADRARRDRRAAHAVAPGGRARRPPDRRPTPTSRSMRTATASALARGARDPRPDGRVPARDRRPMAAVAAARARARRPGLGVLCGARPRGARLTRWYRLPRNFRPSSTVFAGEVLEIVKRLRNRTSRRHPGIQRVRDDRGRDRAVCAMRLRSST